MSKKAQLQISFGWLFAIIAGIFIIALAIYASVQFIDLGQQTTGAESIAEIGVLLNPLETSFESSTSNLLEFPQETRIHNVCEDFTNFGTQRIRLAQKSFGEFEDIDVQGSFKNKYIFSNESVQGKQFYLFSKSFAMPFDVASLIYLTSENQKYCFMNPPEDIKEEISNLNQANLFLDEDSDCEEDSIRVCFNAGSGSECEIEVNTFSKSVIKETPRGIEEMYYETDALMFAAIFSSEEVYECQVLRLMDRVSNLASIYESKSSILAQKGCPMNLNPLTLSQSAKSVSSSGDLIRVRANAESLDNQNDNARCELW